MTKTLEQAIEILRQMPEERQESLAQLLLHEIREDEQWVQSTARHGVKLQSLVDDVLKADDRRECEPLEPETL
jgi:hypothetical protein